MATVRDGIYLEDNPPARSQFREGRRDPLRAVIEVHTAESGLDLQGEDDKAENVADFIRRRAEAGSYHLVGDRDSIIQLVDFRNEAFHDRTGSNRWAVGISLAMDADAWPDLGPKARAEYLDTAAQMAEIAARFIHAEIGQWVPATLLPTRDDSDRRPGFTGHGFRDPGRRTDPGEHFPWDEFLRRYRVRIPEVQTPDLRLQLALIKVGADIVPDGIVGPKTIREGAKALEAHLAGQEAPGGVPSGSGGPVVLDPRWDLSDDQYAALGRLVQSAYLDATGEQ